MNKKVVHFKLYQGMDDIRFLCHPQYIPLEDEIVTSSIERTTCLLCLIELLTIEDSENVQPNYLQ